MWRGVTETGKYAADGRRKDLDNESINNTERKERRRKNKENQLQY
jgi:hypothetical protein